MSWMQEHSDWTRRFRNDFSLRSGRFEFQVNDDDDDDEILKFI